MHRTLAFMIATVGLSAAASTASATDAAERKDRATYNRLVRQIRVSTSKLRDLEARAVQTAHRNGGRAPDPIKAEILSIQDEIDRKTNRLELITLRHGWDVPDFSQDNMMAGEAEALSSREEVFAPVNRMVQRAMQRSATGIAASVHLPVISNPACHTEKRS